MPSEPSIIAESETLCSVARRQAEDAKLKADRERKELERQAAEHRAMILARESRDRGAQEDVRRRRLELQALEDAKRVRSEKDRLEQEKQARMEAAKKKMEEEARLK